MLNRSISGYLQQVSSSPYEPIFADSGAQYERVITVDGASIEFSVACPHDVGNVKTISEASGKKIDQALIGSCTNARYEDLVAAAKILKGHKISPSVRLIVTPASKKVYEQALKDGLLEVFHSADAVITNSTCRAFAGLHLGLIGPGEVCIGTQNRNFKGRMGSEQAEIYLASPATVAASAIEGTIADPRKFL